MPASAQDQPVEQIQSILGKIGKSLGVNIMFEPSRQMLRLINEASRLEDRKFVVPTTSFRAQYEKGFWDAPTPTRPLVLADAAEVERYMPEQTPEPVLTAIWELTPPPEDDGYRGRYLWAKRELDAQYRRHRQQERNWWDDRRLLDRARAEALRAWSERDDLRQRVEIVMAENREMGNELRVLRAEKIRLQNENDEIRSFKSERDLRAQGRHARHIELET